MSPPEQDVVSPLKDADNEPVFREGWHAQILGVAANLVESGQISANDWMLAFSEALRSPQATGMEDEQEAYYVAALAAVESLLANQGGLPRASVDERTELWRRAYLNTPHGAPVELDAGRHHDEH